MGKGCANYPKNGKSFTATYLVAFTLDLKAAVPVVWNNALLLIRAPMK